MYFKAMEQYTEQGTGIQSTPYLLDTSYPSIFETDFQTVLFENDFKAIFPELFLVLATIFLLLYGVIYSTSSDKTNTNKKANLNISYLTSVASNKSLSQTSSRLSIENKSSTFQRNSTLYPQTSFSTYPLLLTNISWLGVLCLVFSCCLMVNNPISHSIIFYNTLILDDFTFFLKILVLMSSLFAIIIALDYVKKETFNAFEYIILIQLATCSMLFLIASADFISMYLAIELQSLCFYVLAASKRNSEFSTEAGLKYFLLGAFSSGILLFGCSLIYGFTGVTNFAELAKIFTCGAEDISSGTSALKACELGMVFILVGLLFKMTAVPFHMWAPDVYEGAPTSITAFFSITPKVSIVAVLLRVFVDSFYDFMLPWQKILIFCSIASMILGAFAAMSQNKIKRLLAFSSIGHVGYLLIGVCCGTVEGLQALFIYLVIYIVMTINIFAIVLSPVKRLGSNFVKSVQRVKYTTDFSMLAKTNPILAITLTVALFSMAGIPPLAGFYSKAFLFFAAMSSTMYLLALIGVLTSVVSCFYYIRLIKIMYFENPKNWCSFSRISKENSYILGITFFFMLFFMVYPSPLYVISHKVALALCS
jgi:proton-translocating NADH-quinone oxidoreductase chain N